MKQYEEKYNFINKALLESIIHITEMTKTDHPMGERYTATTKAKTPSSTGTRRTIHL